MLQTDTQDINESLRTLSEKVPAKMFICFLLIIRTFFSNTIINATNWYSRYKWESSNFMSEETPAKMFICFLLTIRTFFFKYYYKCYELIFKI